MGVDATPRCCAGLRGGGGPGVARKLPQVLAELAQKVLCGLCRSALHDQTLQLRPLLLDPLAGLRHPFLDAVGADGLCHSYLQPRLLNDERRHLVPGGTPHRNAVSRLERKRGPANASVQGMPMPVGTRLVLESFRRTEPPGA